MTRFTVLLIALFFGAYPLTAQTDSVKVQKPGAIAIIQSPAIKELAQKHVAVNEKVHTIGYRIKIHFGGDKKEAYEIQEKFLEENDSVAAYVSYNQPYFNVTIGNYRTKLEAYRYLKQVQSEYPAAFLIQCDVDLAENKQ